MELSFGGGICSGYEPFTTRDIFYIQYFLFFFFFTDDLVGIDVRQDQEVCLLGWFRHGNMLLSRFKFLFNHNRGPQVV